VRDRGRLVRTTDLAPCTSEVGNHIAGDDPEVFPSHLLRGVDEPMTLFTEGDEVLLQFVAEPLVGQVMDVERPA
jgi:hypothetical protein